MADHLRARAQQEFTVELESHPGSGAMWRYEMSPGTPQLVREELKPVNDSIGSPAIQVFTFRADQPGRHTLTFELKREWEPAARSRKEITVDVD